VVGDLAEFIIPAFYPRSSEIFCRTRMDGNLKKQGKGHFYIYSPINNSEVASAGRTFSWGKR